jgi:murein DD-endopeptidase MepM/ murein hydrolase activator NlpD
MIPYKGTYKVTQPYKGSEHQGIDLVGIDSKNIYSTVDGVVLAATKDTYFDGGMGNYVKIFDRQSRRHLFAHLSEFSVFKGQSVKQGDLIGVEGNTGHSFGSHCHYEMRATDSSTSYLNVAEIMQIPNKIGTYESEAPMTKEEAKKIVQNKLSLSDKTIEYIADDYRWGDDLIIKIAEGLQK